MVALRVQTIASAPSVARAAAAIVLSAPGGMSPSSGGSTDARRTARGRPRSQPKLAARSATAAASPARPAMSSSRVSAAKRSSATATACAWACRTASRHGRSLDRDHAVLVKGRRGQRNDLAVALISGTDRLSGGRRIAEIGAGGRIRRHDDERATLRVEDRDRHSQQLVERRGDLGGTSTRGDDAREALVDVEHSVESLPLRLEQRIEHGCRGFR